MGFNSPCISQKDLMAKIEVSNQSSIFEGLPDSFIEKMYIFWRRKRGQQQNSLLWQFWKRYSYEDVSAEAIFKSRVPSVVHDPKSKLRKKGRNVYLDAYRKMGDLMVEMTTSLDQINIILKTATKDRIKNRNELGSLYSSYDFFKD